MATGSNNQRGGLRVGSVLVTLGSCALFTAGGLAWVHQGKVHQVLGERISNAERQIRNLEVQLVDDRREYTQLTSWASLRARASTMGLAEVPVSHRIFIIGHPAGPGPVEPAPAVPKTSTGRAVGATIASLPH